MITGFNTDIEHEGVIYHVQTEDKGVSTPLILSLVYNRGTILASKRSPYNDLLVPAFDEKALSERLQKQHKLICAAVRAGRIEDLKRMGKDAAPRQNRALADVKPVAEKKELSSVNADTVLLKPEAKTNAETITAKQPPNLSPPQTASGVIQAKEQPEQRPEQQPKQFELDLPEPSPAILTKIETKPAEIKENVVFDLPVDIIDEETIFEAIEIIEEETILAAEAVAIISDAEEEKPRIVDNKLKIQLPSDVIFRSGERKTVGINVYRGAEDNGAGGAHIMIKVFGAAFRPLIFHAKTDARGTANVHLQMPQFRGGRAAILIKAMSDGEETELRRAIEQS